MGSGRREPRASRGGRQTPHVALPGARQERGVASRSDPVDEPFGSCAGHHAIPRSCDREHLPHRQPDPGLDPALLAPTVHAAVIAGQGHRPVAEHGDRPDDREAVVPRLLAARSQLDHAFGTHHQPAGLGLRVIRRAVRDPPLRLRCARAAGLCEEQPKGRSQRRPRPRRRGGQARAEPEQRSRSQGHQGGEPLPDTAPPHGAPGSTVTWSWSSPRTTPPSVSRRSSRRAASPRCVSSPAACPLASRASAEIGSSG